MTRTNVARSLRWLLLLMTVATTARAQWRPGGFNPLSCSESSRMTDALAKLSGGPAPASPPAPGAPGAPERRPPPESRPSGAPCESDNQCAGVCLDGRCATHRTFIAPPTEAPQCQEDENCPEGLACRRFKCVQPKLPPVPPESAGDRPHSRPVVDASMELLLLERGPQLREELALGRGPLLSTIARVRGLEAHRLGVFARAHRQSLGPLVETPRQFLVRLDEVMRRTVAER